MRYCTSMNQAKVTDLDYINFLVASPLVFSCTEAARVQPAGPRRAAHDALTRLLQRLEPDPTPLWNEARQHVILHDGLLIIDDTTLDKPYGERCRIPSSIWNLTNRRGGRRMELENSRYLTVLVAVGL